MRVKRAVMKHACSHYTSVARTRGALTCLGLAPRASIDMHDFLIGNCDESTSARRLASSTHQQMVCHTEPLHNFALRREGKLPWMSLTHGGV